MNMTLLRFVLVLGCAVAFGCENPGSDADFAVSDAVELDLELASVRSTLAAGDVISEVRPHDSAQAWTIVWPWHQLVGEDRPAPHNEASIREMLEGCNEIAYMTLLEEAPQPAASEPQGDVRRADLTRDVSGVICASCHQTLNHIAPL